AFSLSPLVLRATSAHRTTLSSPTRRSSDLATIRGENFKAVHTPEADVDISPALELQLDGSRLTLGGEVLVPRARITPRQIAGARSEEHTSELQSRENLVCRLLLEKKKKFNN